MPAMLIMPYYEKGSLQSYIKRRAEEAVVDPSLSLPEAAKIGFMRGIARGMAHLVQHHFVHRDLATRNVLLDAKLEPKVADFGLSRLESLAGDNGSDYYRSSGKTTIALRWTPPEAMLSLKFNEATDVWSFGVTAMEIFTAARDSKGDINRRSVNSLDFVNSPRWSTAATPYGA